MSGGHLVARAVLVGALAAGLALGACGRKSGLDAPPSASLANNQPINQPPSLGEQPNPFQAAPPPPGEPPPATAPSAPGQTPAKKTFILDWLLK